MEYFSGDNIGINSPAAVVVGNFDGLHIGHMKLINAMKYVAKEKGLKTVVVSFSPHPLVYFGKVERLEQILTLEQKKYLLGKHGIDFYIELPFNKELAEMSPLEFFDEVLIGKLNCFIFVMGEDYKFGKDREGDAEMAKKICATRGIDAMVISTENNESMKVKVSSSTIRTLISEGDLCNASKLLGYNYSEIKRSHNAIVSP